MDEQFRKLEMDTRTGRYQLWMNTISKYRQAWKTNKRTRHEMDMMVKKFMAQTK